MHATDHTAYILEKNESECVSYNGSIHTSVGDTVPLTLASSVLSLLGSGLTILTFALWKDLRRSTARQILLFLAVADFFTAAGYFAASATHWHFFPHENPVNPSLYPVFDPFCTAQSFVVATFSTSSFFWTAYLAVYFVLVLVYGVYRWNRKLIVFFNVTAWIIPLAICTTAAALEYLGPGNMELNATPGICFIAINTSNTSSATFDNKITVFFVLEALGMKLWEVLAMVVISVCYVMIFIYNRCFASQAYQYPFSKIHSRTMSTSVVSQHSSSSEDTSAYAKSVVAKSIKQADLKLLAIPFVFILFRLWGTIRYFVSMRPDCHQYSGFLNHDNSTYICVEQSCFDLFYHPVLLYAQALFDPLQGFGNAILFIFLSKAIMRRLLFSVKSFGQFCSWSLSGGLKHGLKMEALSLNQSADEREPLIRKKYPVQYERPLSTDSSNSNGDR